MNLQEDTTIISDSHNIDKILQSLRVSEQEIKLKIENSTVALSLLHDKNKFGKESEILLESINKLNIELFNLIKVSNHRISEIKRRHIN